jgi:hypothetical protein
MPPEGALSTAPEEEWESRDRGPVPLLTRALVAPAREMKESVERSTASLEELARSLPGV